MTADIYKQVLYKFFAVMRYHLYHKIKSFWEENKDHFESNPAEPDSDEEATDNPLPEDEVLVLAQEIDPVAKMYTEVLGLFNVHWDLEVLLSIKKMEYQFQHQLQDENLQVYIECLTEAHNQMLFFI
mmetsp:Transcript_38062/g.58091  ORF Transcript_38062/g.58091 Transcript_38062/m.58091 type:complete len:127 (+) Transcript_38062:67-447(+)|eukprot:CAMPEP_0170509082 /NCGR_PEP_ID=MMETSP0208-20121228/64313_1 /TAXON_ID=197538 /ORGANISM="Strombidium inclinatum, Strain S3" /LENGTH=126 /DNA_ID=CAMNT_0010792307 /DNA_START=51 /DNA_END=431 /DNA_ORIENTATION=+